MKILVVRLSSMGDVIHTLPALSDASKNIPTLEVDWVVDKAFAQIPKWHPSVVNVYPIDLRKAKKKGIISIFQEFSAVIKQIRMQKYDLVIDSQGLLKSMLIAFFARGKTVGFSKHTIKEPVASYGYNKTVVVPKLQHAITRNRELFAKALGYNIINTQSTIDYGIPEQRFKANANESKPYIALLHGTTWPSKHWPDNSWADLANIISHKGFDVGMVHSGEEQEKRVKDIVRQVPSVKNLGAVSIDTAASWLSNAYAVVSVDTGFGHLAAALNKPVVSIYGPTSRKLTGILTTDQGYEFSSKRNCAPCLKRTCDFLPKNSISGKCMEDITAQNVWSKIEQVMSAQEGKVYKK